MLQDNLTKVFLLDLLDQVKHGHDPRNWIGMGCGIDHYICLQLGLKVKHEKLRT